MTENVDIISFLFGLFEKFSTAMTEIWEFFTKEFTIDIFDFNLEFQTIDLILGVGIPVVLTIGVIKYFIP